MHALGAEAVHLGKLEGFEIGEGDAEGAGEDQVSQLWVTGQSGTVHVGSDDAALHGAFTIGAAGGIAVTSADGTQGLGVGAEDGAAEVVFKAGEGL